MISGRFERFSDGISLAYYLRQNRVPGNPATLVLQFNFSWNTGIHNRTPIGLKGRIEEIRWLATFPMLIVYRKAARKTLCKALKLETSGPTCMVHLFHPDGKGFR